MSEKITPDRAYEMGESCTLLYCPERFEDSNLQYYFELGFYNAKEEHDYTGDVSDDD